MYMGRNALLAVASLTLLATAPLPAAAASAGAAPKADVATSADELSARARQRQVRHYRRGVNPGGAAAFGAIAGTIGGIIATEQANRYYRRQYEPYGYGYGAPYGYAPSYGYGYAPSYGYGGYAPSYYAPY